MQALRVSCFWLGGLLLFSSLLGGCALAPPDPDRAIQNDLPLTLELTNTAFFPQTQYQCGPAALATLLASAELAITPEKLAPQVYLPERQGSLQLELIAAARRQDRIPFVLEPSLVTLLREITAKHPVLVLQNLGLPGMSRWHYAVVIGFNQQQGNVMLRSGAEARQVLPYSVFLKSWDRANRWAMVALSPQALPATATEKAYLLAVAAVERLGKFQTAATAFHTATARWPKSLGAWIGLGNSYYGMKQFDDAESAFVKATTLDQSAATAWNNLADTRMRMGKWKGALDAAQQAVALGRGDQQRAVYQQTLDQIRQMQSKERD